LERDLEKGNIDSGRKQGRREEKLEDKKKGNEWKLKEAKEERCKNTGGNKLKIKSVRKLGR
jgi:hypothetical protein